MMNNAGSFLLKSAKQAEDTGSDGPYNRRFQSADKAIRAIRFVLKIFKPDKRLPEAEWVIALFQQDRKWEESPNFTG
jgi:hypothetical protein